MIVRDWLPSTAAAFDDYVQHSVTLSAMEVEIMSALSTSMERGCDDALDRMTARERAACRAKLLRLVPALVHAFDDAVRRWQNKVTPF